MSDQHPCAIRIDDGQLTYQCRDEVLWSLPVARIALVGEYTNDHGPFADDYFIVFVTRDRLRHEMSYYARGVAEVMRDLQELLGEPLLMALASSTHWETRIIWPRRFTDQEFLSVAPAAPEGAWQRLLAFLGAEFRNVSLSSESLAALESSAEAEGRQRSR